jgi:hypothetical protein
MEFKKVKPPVKKERRLQKKSAQGWYKRFAWFPTRIKTDEVYTHYVFLTFYQERFVYQPYRFKNGIDNNGKYWSKEQREIKYYERRKTKALFKAVEEK